ncbi:Hypothetical protein NG00_01794 [Corynebacterium camporealensis]|uniref:Uncharacterized protein n=1 Tax=Corynebacterium camporealensis TaxID=161896 RepID=A0A0F6QZP1_9CORY|nr:hypothetical protein [Corynebacterium camporealensis]AKE39938.1 hypothetical protein UL81_10020 [Corynebacterium camporealensis]AVH89033.1 Hypothetical protein NG00_01794 [Corynebacterium camporealensis]
MGQDLSNEEFQSIFEGSREYISDEESPWTRMWIERMIDETRALSNAGKEMTAKRMVSSMIVSLAKIEEAARNKK